MLLFIGQVWQNCGKCSSCLHSIVARNAPGDSPDDAVGLPELIQLAVMPEAHYTVISVGFRTTRLQIYMHCVKRFNLIIPVACCYYTVPGGGRQDGVQSIGTGH